MKIKKTSKNLILTTISLSLCGVFLVSDVFAADIAKSSSGVLDFATMLRVLSDLFSWFWIVIANIVGRLMTNSFVYGEAIYFDGFLWKIWQITRNIANFGLGFIFLYEILKYVINPSETKTPMGIIKDLLKTGVAIQLSRFAIMVIIDISTVLFALVSSFPSQVIGSDAVFSQALSTVIDSSCPDKITVDNAQPQGNVLCKGQKEVIRFMADAWWSKLKNASEAGLITVEMREGGGLTKEQLFDGLLPSQDSLSWPLMFIGFEIFKTAQLSDYSKVQWVSEFEKDFKQIFQIVLHSGMMILYTLSLLVLMVVLVARGVYLWIFIAISPIVVLLNYLVKPKKHLTDDIFRDIGKMIKLCFQPVYYAMFIGLMMIMLVILNWALKFNMTNNESPIQITDSQLRFDNNLINVSMEWGTMRIYDLLLGAITLFLMWKLVHLAITQETWIKGIDTFTKNVSKMAEGVIETTPIIPVPWTNINVGAWAFLKENLLNSKFDAITGEFTRKEIEQSSTLAKTFGFDTDETITKADKESLSRILTQTDLPAKRIDNYINKLNTIKRKFYFSDVEWDLLSIFSDKEYQKVLALPSYDFSGVERVTDEKSFYEYLDQNNRWKKLYKVFFDSDNAPSSKDDLVNNKEKYVIQRAS